jgi:O-antigen biosynthesis protein
MELSIVIVNYNVRHFLEQCLHSVRKAAASISCEIFVVDNNSADGSCAMVIRNFPEVKLIRNNKNVGFSAGCNQAIRLAKGRFVLLLNPDTLVEEDTFNKCIGFIDNKPDAGAIGVKMINGNGKLLPESKRAFPTPSTALFKMTGLSRLFPESRYFNRYYLGHLDSSKTTEADIISGAFMFIRREALEKTGLLDERFFMYGEDIDLSYRLIKAGFKNYYFPEVKIIHFKGESTKKSEINYIIYFYRAMLIFTSKHFGNNGYGSLRMLLRIAIFFRGFAALLKNLVRKYFLPITDALIITAIFLIITPLWADIKFGGDYHYPDIFSIFLIPSFCIICLLSIYFAGGYKIPSRISRVVRGILTGASVILIIYALLPLNLRFSRAVLVLGGISTLTIIPLFRLAFSLSGFKIAENPFARARKVVIVSNEDGFKGILNLVNGSKMKSQVLGRVSIKPDDLTDEVLGNVDQLTEIVRINRIREVIFSTRELTASEIINLMQILSGMNINIKISPAGENVIIGSNFLNRYHEIQGS